jgi:hypothetical protein
MTPSVLLIAYCCACVILALSSDGVKKEILRILALNSECENTSSVLVGPFCAMCHVGNLNLGQLL